MLVNYITHLGFSNVSNDSEEANGGGSSDGVGTSISDFDLVIVGGDLMYITELVAE